MPIHVFSVESVLLTEEGLRLMPGIPVSDDRPEVGQIIQGCNILLKKPDGTQLMTRLLSYGVGVTRLDNGDFAMSADPLIELIVDLPQDAVPVGSEVWIGYVLQ